jgi:hypothetical protein
MECTSVPTHTLSSTFKKNLLSTNRTAAPTITFTMREVLKNHKLLGSTMGSKKDLKDATEFLENCAVCWECDPWIGKCGKRV